MAEYDELGPDFVGPRYQPVDHIPDFTSNEVKLAQVDHDPFNPATLLTGKPQVRSRWDIIQEHLPAWMKDMPGHDMPAPGTPEGKFGPPSGQMPWPETFARAAFDLAGAPGTKAVAGGVGKAIFSGMFGAMKDAGKMAELNAAKHMVAMGGHPEDIWHSTGWFQGADGKWRHEIKDIGSSIIAKPGIPPGQPLGNERIGAIGDILHHPELYKYHPELKNLPWKIDPTLPAGHAEATSTRIGLPKDFLDNPQNYHGVLLHELQHHVQNIEKFAQGGAPWSNFRTQFDAQVTPLLRERMQLRNAMRDSELSQEQKDRLGYLNQVNDTWKRLKETGNLDAYTNYARLSGEVEARNVELRLLLEREGTSERGYHTYPQLTEDIPREFQIASPRPMSAGPVYGSVGAENTIVHLGQQPVPFDPLMDRPGSFPGMKLVPVEHDPFGEAPPSFGAPKQASVPPGPNAGGGGMAQPDQLTSLREIARSAAQPGVKASLPAPKNILERAWDNYTKRMSEGEALQAEATWGTASRLAQEKGISEQAAFARVMNDWYKRKGISKRMTEDEANAYTGGERGSSMLDSLMRGDRSKRYQ